jgi:ABC-type tungstate transport system permease subunit
MAAGHGIDRKLVMHNDFIIVGPPDDPAGIMGMTSAVEALEKMPPRARSSLAAAIIPGPTNWRRVSGEDRY